MNCNCKIIVIPEGNSFILAITVQDVETLSSVSSLAAYTSMSPNIPSASLKFTTNGNVIKIPFERLKQGEYNVWVTFSLNGQKMSFNYKSLFKIVAWGNRFINWDEYREGSEIAIQSGTAIVTNFEQGDWESLLNKFEELETLKAECEAASSEAHEAAEYAKQEGDYAKEVGDELLAAKEHGDFKGEPGYTPQKGVDYFDGEDGEPGQDGAPGKDGRDGGLLYPKFRIDPHNMHLYCSEDTNRIYLDKKKHLRVRV